MRYLAYIFYVIATIGIITGCSDQREQYARVLDIAAQQNVNYDSITHIDSIEAAVKYFDRQGTSNERMRAHYLLGCAYYEAGETPKAMECYQDAIDCADTTIINCDLHTLSRIHGQMARIFLEQEAPLNALEHMNMIDRIARKDHDTLMILINKEQQAEAYRTLNKLDTAIQIRQNVSRCFEALGDTTHAAFALGPIIDLVIDKGNYPLAKEYMDRYEKYSGFFDEKGEIIEGLEVYYYSISLYHLRIHQLDSAEYYARKIFRSSRMSDLEAAYKALYLIYKENGPKDSLAKYAMLAYEANDSVYRELSTETYQRMQSIYNYSRSQRLAQQMAEKARRNQLVAILILAVAIVLGSFSYQYYRRKRQEHHQEIQNWQEKGQKLEAALNVQKKKVTNEELMATPSYKRIKEVLTIPNEEMSRKDWEQLRKMIDEKIPSFYSTVIGHRGRMDILDYHVCILVRLYFTNGEIAFLTGNQPNTISMKRKRLLQKVFGIEGPPELFDKKVQEIC